MSIYTRLFNLHKGENDKEQTLENVKSNISFSGPNLWVLVCAIIIASVGLNVNSTAVIIGAMLISPLMGPIVGAGFALGIYDFDLLKRSLRNLLIATLAGLIVSFIYFFISPFKEVQSEILSRTAPNIYDVIIAFSGGLVGVIAVTRVEKGNPIPGVAIATALMPPLCTAGYGLATSNFKFFFGALFLYIINCVFICISTFIIVKYLKYQPKLTDEVRQKRVRYGITAAIVLMIVPSLYFAYDLYVRQKFTESVNTFINTEFVDKGLTIIYKKTNYNANPKTIEVAFLSNDFSPTYLENENKLLPNYGLTNTKLIIKQDTSLNIQSLKNDILNEVNLKNVVLDNKDKRISLLEAEIKNNTFDSKQILKETKTIFPEVTSLSIANHTYYLLQDSSKTTTVVIYQASKDMAPVDVTKMENWLKQRLSIKTIELYKKY